MDTPVFRSAWSIGSQCLTTTILQNAGMREGSGPFDWIFSSLGMVCDCLDDDFAEFLNPGRYRSVVASGPDADHQLCDHVLYHERHGITSMFVHANPTVPERYAYLVRCVERFRQALQGDSPNILIGLCTAGRGSVADFHRLAQRLDRTAATQAIVVMIGAPAAHPAFTLRARSGRHAVYDLEPLSAVNGIEFANPADNIYVIEQLRKLVTIDPGVVVSRDEKVA